MEYIIQWTLVTLHRMFGASHRGLKGVSGAKGAMPPELGLQQVPGEAVWCL